MADLSTILATSGLVKGIYEAAGQAASDTANANALNIQATGDTGEAGEYTNAASIASQNANLAELSGQLEQFQNTRQLMTTLGAQRAGVAGAGFQQSGTALGLARSSLQQGLLQNQILGTNANLTAGGYLAQAQANTAEATAATTAASAASANATGANNLAAIAAASQATSSNFLNQIPGAAAILQNLNNPNSGSIPNFGSFGGGGISNNPLANTGIQPTFGAPSIPGSTTTPTAASYLNIPSFTNIFTPPTPASPVSTAGPTTAKFG